MKETKGVRAKIQVPAVSGNAAWATVEKEEGTSKLLGNYGQREP